MLKGMKEKEKAANNSMAFKKKMFSSQKFWKPSRTSAEFLSLQIVMYAYTDWHIYNQFFQLGQNSFVTYLVPTITVYTDECINEDVSVSLFGVLSLCLV